SRLLATSHRCKASPKHRPLADGLAQSTGPIRRPRGGASISKVIKASAKPLAIGAAMTFHEDECCVRSDMRQPVSRSSSADPQAAEEGIHPGFIEPAPSGCRLG